VVVRDAGGGHGVGGKESIRRRPGAPAILLLCRRAPASSCLAAAKVHGCGGSELRISGGRARGLRLRGVQVLPPRVVTASGRTLLLSADADPSCSFVYFPCFFLPP